SELQRARRESAGRHHEHAAHLEGLLERQGTRSASSQGQIHDGKALAMQRCTTHLGVGIWELGVNAVIVLLLSGTTFAQGPTYRFGSATVGEDIQVRTHPRPPQ